MLSKGNAQFRRLLRKSFGPFAQPLVNAVSTAQFIIPSPHQRSRLLFEARSEKIQLQPDVYPFAAFLAERFDCAQVIAIGRLTASDLLHLCVGFKIIAVAPPLELHNDQKRFPFVTWLGNAESLPEHALDSSLIVCTDLDRSTNFETTLNDLQKLMKLAPVCLLTAADRDRTGSIGGWSLKEFEKLLLAKGLNVEFVGWTAADNVQYEKNRSIAVITREPMTKVAPIDFRVVAFMAAYNEEDIIVQSVKKWTDQGVNVHILENWSTDSTYKLVNELARHLPVTVERFPQAGPSDHFDWGAMLERIEALSKEIEADWFIRRGADEVLTSPWPGVSYKDALYIVDQAGYNCVDHTIVEFHPVDNDFKMGMDHEVYFKHFDFQNLSHANQRKAWKNSRQEISSIASAGHDVLFEGRRVYPFKFLLKHYSFRSQAQAEKKVFRERKARWNPKERAKGWHIHYDAIKEGHQFVQSPTAKAGFEEDDFSKTYLIERLSGIGTHRRETS